MGELNSPIPVHFSSLIPKCRFFAISCLTTSNLPWFMDLTFQVSMQYCFLQLFTALDFASITSHIHNWVLFLLWLCLCILSGVIFPLFSSNILGTTDLESSSFSVKSFCLFILFMGFSRQEYWSGLPFPSPVDLILSELSTMTCLSWVPYMAWLIVSLSWTRLLSMWLDCLLFCDCSFSLCPRMPSPRAYHLIGVSLTLDVGYLLMAAVPDLGRGVSPLGPSPFTISMG